VRIAGYKDTSAVTSAVQLCKRGLRGVQFALSVVKVTGDEAAIDLR
jgi:hypothetical protein